MGVETVSTGTKVTMVSNLVLNLLLSAALHQLFSMVKSQQLIILMVLFNIQFPANAAVFYNFLMQIASFDLIPMAGIYDYLFPVLHSEALNERFKQLGFDTMYFQYNLGSLMLAFLALPLQLVAYVCFIPLKKKIPCVGG